MQDRDRGTESVVVGSSRRCGADLDEGKVFTREGRIPVTQTGRDSAMELSSSPQPHFNHHSSHFNPCPSVYYRQNGSACGANDPSGSGAVVRSPSPPCERTLTIRQLVDSTSHHCGHGTRTGHHLQDILLTEHLDPDRHPPPLRYDPPPERAKEADTPPDSAAACPRPRHQPANERKCIVADLVSS